MEDGRQSTEHTDSSRGVSQTELHCGPLILEAFHFLMSDKKHPFYSWASKMSPAPLQPLLSAPEEENLSILNPITFQQILQSEVRSDPGPTTRSASTARFSPSLPGPVSPLQSPPALPLGTANLPQHHSADSTQGVPWGFLDRNTPKCN